MSWSKASAWTPDFEAELHYELKQRTGIAPGVRVWVHNLPPARTSRPAVVKGWVESPVGLRPEVELAGGGTFVVNDIKNIEVCNGHPD